jgi:autotransporter-associated beta strand protein
MKTKSPLLRLNLHRNGLLLAALALLAAPQAQAQLYTGSGSSGLWSTNRWSADTNGPFTAAWGDNSDAVFLENTAYTFTGGTAVGRGTTNIGNVTVGSGASVVFSAISGILGTGGNVRTLDVGTNAILNLNAQELATNAGTGFIKTGDGVYATGAGNFTGGFTLNGGTVVLRGTTGLGSGGANVLTLSNGVIAANANRSLAATRFPGGIFIAGNFQLGALSNSYATNAQALILGTADITFANNVSLEGANRTITLGGNGTGQFTGIISNGGLTVTAGAGVTNARITLTGDNTYTGGTTIGAGVTMRLGNSGSAALAGTTGSILGAITNNGVELIFDRTNNLTSSNNISGTGALKKTGAGTLTLAVANTFSGDTSISGAGNGGPGQLALSNANALSNSVLDLDDGTRLAFVLPEATDYRLGGLKGSATNLVIGSNSLTLGKDAANNNNFAGVISGSGGLTKVGSSTQTLSGANTYTGVTTISGGILSIGNGSTNGTGSIAGAIVNNAGLVFNRTNNITYSDVISGSGTLGKQGAGTLTLSGANTYSGTTTVSVGTLSVNGSTAGGAVSVSSGATLAGSGTVGGATTINSGAFHSPGNSPGVQTFTNGLTYSNGSTFVWELTGNTDSGRGTAFDGVNVSGGLLTIDSGVTNNLVFNGAGSTVNWSNVFWESNISWLVFSNAVEPTLLFAAVFDSLNLSADTNGIILTNVRPNASFAWRKTENNLYLDYSVIPEPSTFALLGLSAAAFGAYRWRRRHRG